LIVAVFVLTIAVEAVADEPTPEQVKAADRIFRDVYGKEYDRVTKERPTPSEKAVLAKKLWDASRGTRENAALARILADKALILAGGDPQNGYPIAVEILRSRVGQGKERPEQFLALATWLDKKARVETPDKSVKTAAELVETYREAAETCYELGRDFEVTRMLAKAKLTASTFLPYAQSAALAREIALDQAEYDALLKLSADHKRFMQTLKTKSDEPAANQGLALIMLRTGNLPEAIKHLRVLKHGDLKTLGDLLAANPPADPVQVGDLFRKICDNFPADKAILLGYARKYFEAALAKDANHPESTRLKLLVQELPILKPLGSTAPPGSVVELIDENGGLAETLAKFEGGTANVTWDSENRYAGIGALRLSAKALGTADAKQGTVPSWKYVITDVPNPGEFRYLRFAMKVPSGSYAIFSHTGAGYVFGKPSTDPRTYSITAKVPGEWIVVTRDLLTDYGSPFSLDGAMKLETDGAVLVDAVYLGRTVRELNRGYPKPATREKQ